MEQNKAPQKGGVYKKVLLALISFGVIALIALFDPNVKDVSGALGHVRPLWLLCALAAAILSYVFNMLMHVDICRVSGIRMSFFECATTTMVGFFYNALTPMQMGGQPMQILQMRGYGVPVGSATSITLIKFVSWQLAVVLIASLGMIVLEAPIAAMGVGVRTVMIIGYALNLLTLLFVALAVLRPVWLTGVGERLLAFLHRHRIIRKEAAYEKSAAAWRRVMGDYGAATGLLFRRKLRGALPLMLFGFLELFCFLGVTYFIYRGFGLGDYPLHHVLLLQSLLSMAVSFVPIPGGAGASEGGFYLVFGSLFGMKLRFPAMLVWRVLTYYLNIFLGLVFIVVDGLKNKRKKTER